MDYEAEKLQDIAYSASDKVPGDFLPVSQLTGQNPPNTINRRFRLGALYFRARSPIEQLLQVAIEGFERMTLASQIPTKTQ